MYTYKDKFRKCRNEKWIKPKYNIKLITTRHIKDLVFSMYEYCRVNWENSSQLKCI